MPSGGKKKSKNVRCLLSFLHSFYDVKNSVISDTCTFSSFLMFICASLLTCAEN